MSNAKGHIPAEKLDDLLHSVMEWADHSKIEGDENTSIENPNQPGKLMRKKQPFFSSFGNVITTLVSAIALLFSGYSFYETVLKEPKIKTYAPALVHMYRKDFRDVLAIPLTISNDGAKRGTILSIDLTVTDKKTGESKTFENLYFGNNPKDTSRIFTPLTMSGRSSKSEVIMFFANKTGAFFQTTGGVKSHLKFDLKINTDTSENFFKTKHQPTLSFDMTASYIQSFRAMEGGRPTVYYKNKTSQEAKAKPEVKTQEEKTQSTETPETTEKPAEE